MSLIPMDKEDFEPIKPQEAIFNPEVGELVIMGKNGLKVVWDKSHPRNTLIEVKDGDVWKKLPYVQQLTINFNMDSLPKVTIQYIIC